jgi:dolichyl-phosphate-mannose-protein mannosyltransferase
LSRIWALIATLMVAAVPSAFHVASSGYIDLALALYVTLAIFALSRWWKDQDRRQLILIAIFLGAALSIKLTAIFVFAAFGLIILLRARNDKAAAGKIVGSGFAALLLAGAIASPWYIRTWAKTGSPVFPFYMSMWKGAAPGWDVERSNLFQAMNSQYGGANKGVVDYLLSPINLSVIAQPEQSAYFDGVIGVAFVIGLPLLIWALWKFELPIEIKIGAGVAGIMYLFWLFSSQQLRYLLPIIPVLAIATVASSEAISTRLGDSFRKVTQLSFAAASAAGMLVSLAWFCQLAPFRVVLGGETRDDYLARNLDYYSYYQWLNTQTDPSAKVWLINMRRDTYDLDRPVVSDYLFEDWTLRNMLWEARSPAELKAKAASLGVQYILTRHDFLFDYDRSTLVDDKKTRPENEAKLKMAKDLVLDPARTVKSDDKFSLVKLY